MGCKREDCTSNGKKEVEMQHKSIPRNDKYLFDSMFHPCDRSFPLQDSFKTVLNGICVQVAELGRFRVAESLIWAFACHSASEMQNNCQPTARRVGSLGKILRTERSTVFHSNVNKCNSYCPQVLFTQSWYNLSCLWVVAEINEDCLKKTPWCWRAETINKSRSIFLIRAEWKVH